MINFDRTPEEEATIRAIAARAMQIIPWQYPKPTQMQLEMDITAAHCNGCPLRLDALLEAEPGHFGHDVAGIRRYINRTTGEIMGHFVPRYAMPQPALINPEKALQDAVFGEKN